MEIKKKMKKEEELVVHNGGCHCKRVRWKVRAPSSVVAWKCNCSDCSIRGNIHFTVPRDRFELLLDTTSDDDNNNNFDDFLSTYTFGTHTAKHIFCKVCGITSFYVPRSSPHGIAVTYKCVDPGTLKHVEIRHVSGLDFQT